MHQNFKKLYDLIEEIRPLKTESGNPLTENLSDLVQENLTLALKNIAEVERRGSQLWGERHLLTVCQTFQRLRQKSERNSQKIFLVGAGASGRMALFVKRALMELKPEDPVTTLIEAVIAGGDAALIHAVPGFEDDPVMAQLQLQKQGFKPGDHVIGFSASGRAPFVLSALDYAHQRGGEALLVHSNPELPPAKEYRSLSLYTEPPAVAGSTRLSPTTHFMMACGVFIEESPNFLNSNLVNFQTLLDHFPFEILAVFLEFEASQLLHQGRLLYEIEAPAFVEQIIFHDLTERTPTAGFFPLRPVKDWVKFSHQVPFSYPIFPQSKTAQSVWKRLLGTEKPFALKMPSVPETSENALFEFDFSQSAQAHWADFLTQHRYAIGVLRVELTQGVLSFSSKNGLHLEVNCNALHPYFQAIFLKVVLNTYSTGLMAKLGLIYGNRMSHLMPTNEKLIARAVLQIEERLQENKITLPKELILKAFLEALETVKQNPQQIPGSLIDRVYHQLL